MAKDAGMKGLLIGFHYPHPADYLREQWIGMANYARQHGAIELVSCPLLDERLRGVPRDLNGIVGGFNQDEQRLLMDADIQPLTTLRTSPLPGVLQVISDYSALADMLVAHAVETGVRNLAGFRSADPLQSTEAEILATVLDYANSAGLDCLGPFLEGKRVKREGWSLSAQISDLAEWIADLPKRCLLVCGDVMHGQRALRAARLAGKQVPTDLAVLCIGDDAAVCETTTPRLTSLVLDHQQKGFEACRMLAAWLRSDRRCLPERLPVPPLGLVVRESSCRVGNGDPNMMRILQAMREWDYDLPTLDAVAQKAGVSRRTLHRRVQQGLAMSPIQLLHRNRVEKAMELLRGTDLSLIEVTDRCAYALPSQLSREVKRETGLTPTQYRRRWRRA